MFNTILTLIRRAFVSLTNNDDKNYSMAQVSYMDSTANMEVVQPYGLYSQAPANALALVFTILDDEENLAGIVYDPSTRFKNMKPGEVLVGSPLKITSIKFDIEGNIVLTATKNITLNAPGTVQVNAPSTVLGDPGSAKNIARLGDQITVNVGGTNYIGTITSAGVNKSI